MDCATNTDEQLLLQQQKQALQQQIQQQLQQEQQRKSSVGTPEMRMSPLNGSRLMMVVDDVTAKQQQLQQSQQSQQALQQQQQSQVQLQSQAHADKVAPSVTTSMRSDMDSVIVPYHPIIAHHDSEDAPTETDVPLHEWVAALTDPVTGPYPNGVTPKLLDRLATDAGIVRFPDYARRRWHKMWTSSNHLCVYLSDEVKAGRIRRVRFGHYAGCFEPNAYTNSNNCNSLVDNGHTALFADACHYVSPNGTDAIKHQNRDEADAGSEHMDVNHITSPRQPFAFAFPTGLAAQHNRTSSFGSQSSVSASWHRRRTQKDLKGAESHAPTNTNGNRLLNQRRRRAKLFRNNAIDEFGLPSLVDDPAFTKAVFNTTGNVQSWSVNQTAAFLQDIGFSDGAKAFLREEIDGTALLLLKRMDILDGMHLKIGPAVKLYRYIRALQKLVWLGTTSSIRNSQTGSHDNDISSNIVASSHSRSNSGDVEPGMGGV